jgi:hypothetical protein
VARGVLGVLLEDADPAPGRLAASTVRSKRVNSPEAKASAPAVMSTTTYSPGPSTRWLSHSSTAPVLEW